MKSTILYICAALLAATTLSSCLFNEDFVGSEFTAGTIEGETAVHLGKADNINYQRKITEAGLTSALETMNKTKLLGQMLSAQYALRGGKQGNSPGPHAYQYQFSLETDNYAGYLCLPQDFGGRMQSTYYNSQDFNGGAMGSFMEMKNFIVPILNHPQINSIPEIKAISLLIYDISAQEVADIYGAFPYVNYKANRQDHPFVYNPLDTIYATIVNNIDTIVSCLQNYPNRPQWYQAKVDGILKQYDRVSPTTGDKIQNWIRLANSLKLRMAMNIVKVEPVLAQKWAEQAVQSGVIETSAQQFGVSPQIIGFSHPLIEISNSWNDTRLNASFESILKAYDHPVLSFLFTKNSHPIINKDDPSKIYPAESGYVGLRSGIRMLSGQAYNVNFRTAYSRISEAILEMPLFVIKLSEVQFLRAEGALRGWNMGGSAESFYNLAIENAYSDTELKIYDELNDDFIYFDQTKYRPALANYMKTENARDIDYVDPYSNEYNRKSTLKVGVKWNNGDNNETKLEKIITQKYIAGFPNSFVAWGDLRRTGYPRIFPVVYDDGDGSIPAGDIIRRIPFSGTSQEAIRNDIANTGLRALGGPDKQGTRLWWDVAGANF